MNVYAFVAVILNKQQQQKQQGFIIPINHYVSQYQDTSYLNIQLPTLAQVVFSSLIASFISRSLNAVCEPSGGTLPFFFYERNYGVKMFPCRNAAWYFRSILNLRTVAFFKDYHMPPFFLHFPFPPKNTTTKKKIIVIVVEKLKCIAHLYSVCFHISIALSAFCTFL